MAGLRKPVLYGLFEQALRVSGWQGRRLTMGDEFPARYRLSQGLLSTTAVLYIWTISHGGGAARAATEYRIQITGLNHLGRFVPEVGGRTLILGWWPEEEVFAGFDYDYHAEVFGASPSVQVGVAALRRAAQDGMAVHRRGNNEIVVAFRPEFMGVYLDGMADLHTVGIAPGEVALLGRIAENPAAVDDAQIAAEAAAPRQRVMANVRRAVRGYKFSRNVLAAYGHQCAFCGVQLRLLDAAHILPVAHPNSTDTIPNGFAACPLHHRAYDQSLITFDAEGEVHLNGESVVMLEDANLSGGLDRFRGALRGHIILPRVLGHRPLQDAVRMANEYRGWDLP